LVGNGLPFLRNAAAIRENLSAVTRVTGNQDTNELHRIEPTGEGYDLNPIQELLVNAPGNFKLAKSRSGVNRDSVVNVSQMITLDKSFLAEQAGKLNNKQINSLNGGLKLVLGI
jgi:hypothetical protein